MKGKLTICNEGCKKEFYLKDFSFEKIDEDIEKVYFKCKHCQREYVAFYLDTEIRSMQAEMRALLGKSNMKQKQIKRSQKLRKQIANKMSELKARVER